MQYRSIAELNAAIVQNLYRLPPDIDLVVGIPRSGLLAANLLSLNANIALTDLDAFIDGRVYSAGTTKCPNRIGRDPGQARRVLVLDDSISTGAAMRCARARVAAAGLAGNVVYGAVYGTRRRHPEADIVFEQVRLPRIFQWNFMHHVALEQACVDLDGVLCGTSLLQTSGDCRVHYRPSRQLGWVVTGRSADCRHETRDWLDRQRIVHRELVMPERGETTGLEEAEIAFKARAFRDCAAVLFITARAGDATIIARIAGKPVLCLETHRLIDPPLSPTAVRQRMIRLPTEFGRRSRSAIAPGKAVARGLLGEHRWVALKAMLGIGAAGP